LLKIVRDGVLNLVKVLRTAITYYMALQHISSEERIKQTF